jgi:hypothetical protein
MSRGATIGFGLSRGSGPAPLANSSPRPAASFEIFIAICKADQVA